MSLERVLITGGNGQLGTDLAEQLSDRAEVRALGHAELDIADDAAVRSVLDGLRPDTVFNCAAYHNVDLCETEEEMSFRINAVAVKRMAQQCTERGAKLVHFSTNYVFDGRRSEPYGEDDLPSPRSIYAISKLAGESGALAYGDRALVVRGSGLYGLHGSGQKGGNFVTRMLNRAREGQQIRMVADQRLQPTFTRELATAVIEAVDADAMGILHLVAGGACSWLEFTEAIYELAGIDAPIEAVATSGPVDRPLNGVLARPRADALGLTPLRDWREALEDYMAAAGYLAAAQ
ncbi:MAG TPA: dTDP-4-dehydrorhamnose reductase [Thermoleophilaceae bacterium]|nr:dTDP-4-dehydrorhamnose reductase [Thermoleophilaceae bacterium]